MMRFRVAHETRYAYTTPVALGHHVAHLSPLDGPCQVNLGTQVEVEPEPAVVREWVDFFGNLATYFSVEQPHRSLVVRASSEVEVRPPSRRPSGDAGLVAWESARDALRAGRDPEWLAVRQFLLESPLVPADPRLGAYAGPSFPPGRPLLEAVEDLMGRIHRDFAYDPAFSTVSTPLSEVLTHRRGVCQDFAHLAIGCLRAQGLAARYVSGYIETQPPAGQPRLEGADASHAWFSVFVPGAAWVDFDPTNNQLPFDRHVTAARGRDFADVTPLKGVLYGGGGHTVSVAVDVVRLAP
jgi:transglutaminase-like putative cysteine protease